MLRKDGTTVVIRDVLGDENVCARLAAALNAWLREPWHGGLPGRLGARTAGGARRSFAGARPPERALGIGRRGRPAKARLTRVERGGVVAAVVGAVAGYVALAVAGTIASDPYDSSFPPGRAGVARRIAFVLLDARADLELRLLGWAGVLTAVASLAFVVWSIVAVNRRRQADLAAVASGRVDPGRYGTSKRAMRMPASSPPPRPGASSTPSQR